MSNKLRKNFVKYFLLLLILYAGWDLNCFEPELKDFENSYQYGLYKSWLQKGEFKTDFPAGFGSKKIVKSFADKNGKTVQVEYDWIDRKIINQKESLPVIFFIEDFSRIKPYLNYLEGFVYRLNAADYKYLQEFCDLSYCSLEYKEMTGSHALQQLWSEHENSRVKIEPVELQAKEKLLQFSLPLKNGKTITISFPIEYDIVDAVMNRRRVEEEKSPKIIPEIKRKIRQTEDTKYQYPDIKTKPRTPAPDIGSLPKINSLTLAEYVKAYHAVRQSKELLNNKISNPLQFLSNEFPDREIRQEGNTISILAPRYKNDFYCDIAVRLLQEEDGINFQSVIDYNIAAKSVSIGLYEQIEMPFLTNDEIERLAPFISQLVFQHRAIGSKLINFLLIHDDVPTTLVMRDGERQIFELDSYANLLLMLGDYWHSHKIYFKVQEVSKKNGHIEFQTFLIADNKKNNEEDMAEILFHLDDEFKIDMIMMILHQGNNRKEMLNNIGNNRKAIYNDSEKKQKGK